MMVNQVQASLKRHMWYLSEELVPLALCDQGVSNETKDDIVSAMLNTGRPHDIPPQKPLMHTRLLEKTQVNLDLFVGERSWLMFQLLGINTCWMHEQSREWPQNAEYRRFCTIVSSLKVVNDCAERSIKDVTEFINYA